jgi:hypothetical protein
MKGAIYEDNPRPLLEEKAAIISNIPPTELPRVFANKLRGADAFLQARQGHVEHLL